jgi:hypothetical protein
MKRIVLSIMLAVSGMVAFQSAALAANTLGPGEILHKGEYRVSSNGRFEFVLQHDGNLVLYDTSPYRPLWSSQTNGKAVLRVVMQHDGNLVMYGPAGAVQWASHTAGQPGSILVVQDDGNIVIYRATAPSWSTNTSQ